MASLSSNAEMLKKLSEQKTTGMQITSSPLTPSQQSGVQKGTAMALTLDELTYILSKNIQKIPEHEKSAMLIEEKGETNAQTLKSVWTKIQSVSPNFNIYNVVHDQMEKTGKDILSAYPFDGKQISKLLEMQELMMKLVNKHKDSPGISAVQADSNQNNSSNNTLNLMPRTYANEAHRQRAYALLAPIAQSCNSEEIAFRTNAKESADGWNLYEAKHEDNIPNDEYLLALLTFKDAWHATKLHEAFQEGNFFTSRSMFSSKAPAVLVMFKKKDLEDHSSSMQEEVSQLANKFKISLGTYAKHEHSNKQFRM